MEFPKGFKTYLYEKSACKRWVEEKIKSLFMSWGFREIILPTIEYFDKKNVGNVDSHEGSTFKFTEIDSGKLLALRSDITPQVARIVSLRMMENPYPLRLSYCGNVFRQSGIRSGEPQEFTQAGLELIGLDSPESDAEMIAVAVEALKTVGLTDFKISIGQIDFFKGIVLEYKLSKKTNESIKNRILYKDRSGLIDILTSSQIVGEKQNRILKLIDLYGTRSILSDARTLCNNDISSAALDNIEKVFDILSFYGVEDSVLIDLGELRGFGYYTGITFDGFVKGVGKEVCGGGRYNNLFDNYGKRTPSTGFAINIDTIIDIMEKNQMQYDRDYIDYLIMDFGAEKNRGIDIASMLREKGYRVARDIISRDIEESLSYAKKNKVQKGLVFNIEDISEDELIEIDILDSNNNILKIKDFICRLQ